ncbi:MAG: T9SS type A sorting domain-containing protein [Cyclobacteriaceae bacterium]
MKSRIGILLVPLLLVLGAFGQDNITALEYYIDTDPGIGNGVSVTITPGLTQDIDFTISTSGLSLGFHELVVRYQDAGGDWSIQQARSFYVTAASVNSNSNLTELEYFFDTDPGVDNGTMVALTPAETVDMQSMISTAALSEGFHELFYRAKDENGVWGIQQSRAFYLSSSSTTTNAQLTELEYFFDTDPGYDLGTSITLTPAETIDVQELISTTLLSEGFHELIMRAKDENGIWGMQKSHAFYLTSSSTTSATNLTEFEYFFDSDPGYGSGTSISLTPASTIDLDALITTAALSNGFHELFVRGMDEDGNWGMQKSRVFYIDMVDPNVSAELSSIEYFIDSDPGIGAATQVPISPTQASIDSDLTIPTSSLPDGSYTIGVRVGDTNGNYSMTEIADFTICTGATADLSATTVCVGTATDFTDLSTGTLAGDVYSWDFDNDGNEDDNTVGNTSFTYPVAGTYTAVLTIDQLACSDSKEITVIVENFPVANAGSDQTIDPDNTVLDATPAGTGETGTWSVISGSGTFSDVNDPTATVTGLSTFNNELRWTVTNDAGGCSTADEVNIFVNEAFSAETDILSVELTNITTTVSIDATAHTVHVEVPEGTNLTSLTPTFTISEGAMVSPTGAQDFSNPVTYTVTAEDGVTTQDWEVTIAEPLSMETDILSFVLAEQSSVAVIDAVNHTVSIEVNLDTDLTSLNPVITVSEGAVVSPSGDQDFTNSVIYTVTAEDGITTQDWTTSVTERPLALEHLKGLEVFPNPTSDVIFITGVTSSYTVSIVDLAGRRIELGNNPEEISLKGFTSGVYMLRIEAEGKEIQTIRIVKQN